MKVYKRRGKKGKGEGRKESNGPQEQGLWEYERRRNRVGSEGKEREIRREEITERTACRKGLEEGDVIIMEEGI